MLNGGRIIKIVIRLAASSIIRNLVHSSDNCHKLLLTNNHAANQHAVNWSLGPAPLSSNKPLLLLRPFFFFMS